jgi:hypothetical protein
MQVRVGMEASGQARWFEPLLAELHFELWIGDAAEIRTKRVRKQKTDRQDAQLILWLMLSTGLRQARITLYSIGLLALADAGGGRTSDYKEFLKGVVSPAPVLPGDLARMSHSGGG